MKIKIGNIEVGAGAPTFIIAEISGNHGGSKELGIEIIRAAKRAGADAVKLQTYRADTITLDSDTEDFLITHGPWEGKKTLFSLYEEAHTPWEWHEDFFKEARKLGLEVFSSPFDLTSVDFLEQFNPSVYKIASPEIVDIPLIKKVAQCGKPVILSTGCSELKDVELAVKTLKENGCSDIILLKCTSSYPAPLEDANLNTIPDMKERFSVLSGLSDHTLSSTGAIASVVLGGDVIEKHFILDKSVETVDSFFSLDEKEFSTLVKDIRDVEKTLGTISYDLAPSVLSNVKWRRSLYVSASIKKGELLTSENIKSVRPAFGLHPMHYEEVLGCKAACDLKCGDRLTWEVVLKD